MRSEHSVDISRRNAGDAGCSRGCAHKWHVKPVCIRIIDNALLPGHQKLIPEIGFAVGRPGSGINQVTHAGLLNVDQIGAMIAFNQRQKVSVSLGLSH